MEHFMEISALVKERERRGKSYLEFLRLPAMSAGVYCLAAGAQDLQKPHHEDEMYYVVSGRAQMRVGDEHRQVGPGSVVFVEAEVEHRFYDIEEDLVILVFFAPAEQM
ncbi:MAG TPA: cupin domain-containing protein [Candidatus Angelobacter sp.]|jgi:mannose-6-phosphate isomerase-like protein (cupin superfamily)|nr:cupin domain-containing protein [Candidatus Angelobacter sp.]